MILEELLPASFKGVPFLLVNNSGTTGGRKTATHEFVNANYRNVEDLGKLTKIYNVTAVISGDNYFAARDRLIDALDEGGKGTLIHPFFGSIQVVAKPYTLTESQRTLGEAVFNLIFEAADDKILPQITEDNSAAVALQSVTTNDLTVTKTTDNFEVDDGHTLSYASSEILLTSFVEDLTNIAINFNPATAEVSVFNSVKNAFEDDITQNISDPASLATAIDNVIASIDDITPDPAIKLIYLEPLYSFNTDSTTLDTDLDVGNDITAEFAELVENERTLTDQITVSSLSYGYRNIVDIEFNNVDELDSALNNLEGNYQLYAERSNVDADILDELQKLRADVEEFMRRQRLSVAKLVDISIKTMPVQVLAYSLYGNIDNTDQLIELNEISDVSFVSGDLKALSNDFT